ncbi:hypothetical protein [Xanthocytophaga flava]|uniref:hypothetical protein n=1 Tax=Xanthocytophaga flava TaxID=3048013 RepID=UPI0028D11789|nr:hypothetical protein [Xanthocytophaga flavus]MDJ1472828.1 hypothetical protein [Xanthocytophaga flavus]
MTHSEYTNYFRALCEKHKDLQHSDQEQHFARIVLSVDELGHSNLDDFLMNENSGLVSPFMILASAENVYEDDKSDNIKKHFAGMFWLLTTSEQEFNAEEEAYDRMEKLAEQFLSRMKLNFSDRINNRMYSLQESTISKVGRIGLYLGVRVGFQFFTTANQALAYDAANWIGGR